MKRQMIWVIAALTLMVVAVSGQGDALNATLSCEKLTADEVRITLTVEQPLSTDPITLYAVTQNAQTGIIEIPTAKCESVNNGYNAELTLLYDFENEYQTDPLVQNQDCRVTYDPLQTTVKLLVLPSTSPNVLTKVYPTIPVSCNISGPVQSIVNNYPIIDFGDIPTQIPEEATLPGLVCVLSDVGGSVITSISFGATFFISCESLTGDVAGGFALSNLILATNPQGTGRTVTLFDNNGCVTRNNPFFQAFTNSSDPLGKFLLAVDGVAYNSSASYEFNETTSLTLEYDVGPLIASFLIPTRSNANAVPTLFLIFDYSFPCTNVNEPQCADQELHCMNTGNYHNRRGKRSDLEVYKAGTMMLEITVVDDREDGATDGIAQNTPATNSVSPTFYWMIGAILGVLLMLVAIVCVVLALRLRRERLYKDEAFERDGHKNPAYN